ncbi:MAG: molybdopterin-guanine dinucleotide biosynthesis protein B [Candidatus Riflebacteria bacterium]|nr:molybdopterin-guanine dinucleotide biosynthesis protein B [Candidatus Riflebacteria bacterium]
MATIIRILGRSGCGKTTFIDKLIPELSPLRVAVIKHTHHELNSPTKEKDTGKHLAAGAIVSVGLGMNSAEAFWQKNPPDFPEMIRLIENRVDLIIVEGGRNIDLPTILIGEEPPDSILKQLIACLSRFPPISEIQKIMPILHALVKNNNEP